MDKTEILDQIGKMRSSLDAAERRLKKGHLYGAYKEFRWLQSAAYWSSSQLSKTTLRAAQDWGHAFSYRDPKGKIKWGVLA